jgi:hypothetical protein
MQHYNTKWAELDLQSRALSLGLWSYSKISLYEDCPKAFQARYMFPHTKNSQYVPLTEVPAAVGTFIHSIFELALKEKADGPFSQLWAEQVEKQQLVHIEIAGAQQFKYNTKALVARIKNTVTKHQLTLQLERKLMHVPLIAYADLIGVSPSNTFALLLDYKTHKETSKRKQKVADQLSFYAMCLLLAIPELEQVKPGCVFVPDEVVGFIEVIYRKDLRVLENNWHTRIQRAITEIKELTDAGSPSTLALPAIKGEACTWCSLKPTCETAHKRAARRKVAPTN